MNQDSNKEKSALRKIFKEKRKSLNKAEVFENSQLICDNFINSLLPRLLKQKPDAIFSLYLDAYNEVCTKFIAEHFIENNIKFCYPKIDKEDAPLKFILQQNNQFFAKNKNFKSIIEPENGQEILPNFLIIPLLAFDKNRNRLGMGGGYFDRTLYHFTTINHKFIAIGLAYDFQLFDKTLPTNNTDQSLDFIALKDKIIF